MTTRRTAPRCVVSLMSAMNLALVVTGLSRRELSMKLAGDPNLYFEVARYRNPRPRSCARWVETCLKLVREAVDNASDSNGAAVDLISDAQLTPSGVR